MAINIKWAGWGEVGQVTRCSYTMVNCAPSFCRWSRTTSLLKNGVAGLDFNEHNRPRPVILQSDKYYEENKAGNRTESDKWWWH